MVGMHNCNNLPQEEEPLKLVPLCEAETTMVCEAIVSALPVG